MYYHLVTLLIKLSKKINLFLDATLIINKYGIENVGYGCDELCKRNIHH